MVSGARGRLLSAIGPLGARVLAGDSLGVVSAPFSSDDLPLLAPSESILIGINRLPLVNEGDALFHLAQFGEASTVSGEIASHGSTIREDPLFDVEQFGDQDLT